MPNAECRFYAPPMLDTSQLTQHFSAGHRCVRIVTSEEHEAVRLGVEAAMALGLSAYTWSVTTGVRNATLMGSARVDDATNPASAMRWILDNIQAPSLIITLDLADQLGDSVNLRGFRDVLEAFHQAGQLGGKMGGGGKATHNYSGSCVLMIDHQENVPASVGAMSIRLDVPPPKDDEIEALIRKTIKDVSQTKKVQAVVSPQFLTRLVQNLRGLSRRQVGTLVAECLVKDGTLREDDLEPIQRRKRRLLRDAGVLEFVDAPASMDEIGGLAKLKDWLRKREKMFGDPTITPPRGLMLLGVQGAGKSLASKAIATAWRRPLMRLDPGALYNKYVGETERNLREALRQAEAMAPVVLWIDEIEKGFASAASTSNDGGVSRRMLGTLLTWMQDHRSPVFMVATANDIEALPPELLRKGRFDEIFFVDLPGAGVREMIFAIHLKKRGYEAKAFDLATLAAATEGFSGAEIEQAVIAGHIDAKDVGLPLTTARIVDVARHSPPLSVTMREKIDELRAWSVGRCVPADGVA
jgi:MoxR-like ATPase